MKNSEITFCIMTLDRTPWLKRTVSAIRRHCSAEYSIKILSQGPPDKQLSDFAANSGDTRVELIVSPTNLGYGGGRRLLAGLVKSPFTMMLDDDMYLTEDSISSALDVFDGDPRLGAVSMPQYDLRGLMTSPGGRMIVVHNRVIHIRKPNLDSDRSYIEVNDVNAGAMLYRTEMRRSFSWDPAAADLEDLDKSIQIITDGKWKQAIAQKGKLVHDRSWLGQAHDYERKSSRINGLSMRRSYRYFRAKWGLRLELRDHLMLELLYPGLTALGGPRLASPCHRLIMMLDERRRSKHYQHYVASSRSEN